MSDKLIVMPAKDRTTATVKLPLFFADAPDELKKLPKSHPRRRACEEDLRLLDLVGETLCKGMDLSEGYIQRTPIEFHRIVAVYKILPYLAGNKPLLKWLNNASPDEVDDAIAKVQRELVGHGNSAIHAFAQLKFLADEVAMVCGVPPIREKKVRSVDVSTMRGYKVKLETGDEDLAVDAMMPLKKMSLSKEQVVRRNAKRRLRRFERKINKR
jgi:hypothetical protein